MSESWTDDRIELLKKLWMDGLSASQIAVELGEGVTRNAVIGKVHRMNLPGRTRTSASPRPRRAVPAVTRERSAPRRERVRQVTRKIDAQYRPAEASKAPAAAKTGQIVPIFTPPATEHYGASAAVSALHLGKKTCKYPIGNPLESDFRFCECDEVVPGSSYCPTHVLASSANKASTLARLEKMGYHFEFPKQDETGDVAAGDVAIETAA